jgi:signal transduction histidine kinase
MVKEQLRGVMTLEHPEAHHFTGDDLRLAKAVANQAAAALRNAQLFERVQSQERELEAVLDSISEGLLAVDHEWRIRLLNPAAQEYIGAGDGIIGKRLYEVTASPFFGNLVKLIGTANLTSGTHVFELRNQEAHRDYVVNVATLHQGHPKEVGYAIALYDVTSLKDLNRLKTHMIRMASHDLKSPLGLLVGYLDLVWTDISKGVLPDQAYIESIYKAVTRMETLIASLLDAHRSDQDSLVAVAIDPYELIQTVLDDVLPVAGQHEHKVIQNVQTNLHPLKGDFAQLREAMYNLIGNAIKYTPNAGTITVDSYTEEDRFYFSVKDTGYGIPADQQKYIFQPYFRATQAATEQIEGTGLGLSLVKEVVERHGGQAWFTSKEGTGSTFGFWLPLLDSPAQEQ